MEIKLLDLRHTRHLTTREKNIWNRKVSKHTHTHTQNHNFEKENAVGDVCRSQSVEPQVEQANEAIGFILFF